MRSAAPVDSLQAFARLYGYVRYFHPTDAAAAADWTALAAQGTAFMYDADTVGEVADRLAEFFGPLAPTVEIWVAGEPVPRMRPPPTGPHSDLLYWQYLGYPGAVLSLYSAPYTKVRVGAESRGRRFSAMPRRDQVVDAEIIPGLWVRVPVILHRSLAVASGARAKDLDAELGRRATSSKGFSDPDVRRGAVVELWNVLRHFYPYQAEVVVDWDAELRRALLDVGDADLQASIEALQRLVHALHDGHGEAGHVRQRSRAMLPFSLELIEERAVIAGTTDPAFKVGDIVETIGGESAVERIARHAALLSGSPQWRQFKAAAWEAPKGPAGERVQVSLRRGTQRLTVAADYDQRAPAPAPRPEPIHTYGDGVWYVDLTRAEWKDIKPRLAELAAAPGVVFDMRGYPTDTHPIIDHLLGAEEDALWMHVPAFVAPDGEVAEWRDLGWHRRPAEPQINGRVAFLTSPGAISYGESVVAYVEAHSLGTSVGGPTAGANGDIVRVDVAGGYFVIFSGMRVTRHDGSTFHREGLQPDLPVKATLSGLQAGRDEILEVGLEVARGEVEGPRSSTVAAP